MTRTTAILLGVALILLFLTGNVWLFSLIDRKMDSIVEKRIASQIILRDQKTGEYWRCYSSRSKPAAAGKTKER